MKQHFNLITLIFLFSILTFSQNVEEAKNISGTVLEIETEKPIDGAIIFLYELDLSNTQMVLTDENGNFVFPNVKAKYITIKVNHLGYDGAEYGPLKFNREDAPTKLNFLLTPIPFQTNEIVVAAEHVVPPLVSSGFYDRKEMGWGKYLTHKDLEKNSILSFSQLFNRFPNIRFDTQNGKIYSMAQKSISESDVAVYLDGVRIDQDINLSTYVHITHIAGVEVFSRIGEMPVQYKGFNSSGGLVLLWTK